MEIASLIMKLLSQTTGGFVYGCFSRMFNFLLLCCLLVLGCKFLYFKCPLLVKYLENRYQISPKIESCSSFDQEHKICNNNSNDGFVSKSDLVDGLNQKKPIILSSDSADGLCSTKSCDHLLLRDGLDLRNNRDSPEALSETELDENYPHSEEEEESRSSSDEDQVFDVITLRKMVKRERKRGDCMKIELEKERRAAESATEEAMAMLLKLQIEKSEVEMEAKQYKRVAEVAEQKHINDQQVIQSLEWMLLNPDDEDNNIQH